MSREVHKKTMDTLKQVQLHQTLLSLGEVAVLKKYAEPEHVNGKIRDFESHFKIYNPRKPGHNRYGLSLTSLDGGFSGIPNLTSIHEYNKEHDTKLSESDFKKRTPFFTACKELVEIMEPFRKHIGRSHVLRLNKGGFSPFHRDCVTLIPDTFRLLISFCSFENFVFLLNDKRVLLKPGRLYFVNTRLAHCVFSFTDKSDLAVFNIDLCEDSVNAVLRHLAVQ